MRDILNVIIIKRRCAALLLILTCMIAPVFAAMNPVTELEGIANQLISQLKNQQANLKDDPQLVYRIANKVIVPHADLDEMSRRVLPPAIWKSATAGQRSQFKTAFTALLVHTYASALANYKDQTVKFFPLRGSYSGKSSLEVNSEIQRTDGPSVPVNYRLVLRGSQWRLFDLSVEGISMLESFRSQFADQLAQGDMASLIRRLQEHTGTRG